MERHTLSISKTARYFMAGEPGPEVTDVWFCFHGYAQLAGAFLQEFDGLTAPERLFVAPEGLSRFYRRGGGGDIAASWMTSLERTDEIEDYVRYIDAVRGQVFGNLDPATRVHALGFSQGAATAARWALLGYSPVKRLILWAGDVPPDLDLLSCRSRLQSTELVMVRGNADTWLSEDRWLAEKERLRVAGIACRFIDFEGGHQLDSDVLDRLV